MTLPILDPSNTLMGFHSIQFSVCSAVILIATFLPKGAFAFNPKIIEGVRNKQEIEEDTSSIYSIRKHDVESRRRRNDEPITP